MMCKPGKTCFICPAADCLMKGGIGMNQEEKEMYSAGIEKGSAKSTTSTEPVNKTSIYIIPHLRHMKSMKQPTPYTYSVGIGSIELWLRAEYGRRVQPIIAPLKERYKFRKMITKESGLYVDY